MGFDFLYCPNLRQKIRLSTKLEFLFFAVYARNQALKVPDYLKSIVGSQVVQHIFGNIFLGYILTNFFTLDDAVPGTEWPEANKSALTTPKDRKTKDELDNFLNRLYEH